MTASPGQATQDSATTGRAGKDQANGSGGPGYPSVSEGVLDRGDRLAQLGLEQHVLDLEQYGYTIVPDVLDPATVAVLAAELVELAGADDGTPVDRDHGSSHRDRTQEVCLLFARGSDTMRHAARAERPLALVRYLLGEQCLLSSFTGYVKGPGRCDLGVHSDTAYVPDPLPPYAQLANVNLLLTDYTLENGCLTMVPGSHRYCFRPREGQGDREVVPVVAAAGSAVVFHGNTWHAALPRTADGVRLTLSVLYARMYMRTQENYAEALTPAEQQALPDELRRLVVPDLPTGWRSVEEARQMMQRRRDGGRTWYRTRGTHA